LQAAKRFLHPDVLHIGQNRCVPAVAPDDSVVVVGASSGLLLLMDMKTGVIGSKLSCHKSAIMAVSWNKHSEDTNVVAASCDRAGALVFWKCAVDDEAARRRSTSDRT
jgi:WD40 repeat protein